MLNVWALALTAAALVSTAPKRVLEPAITPLPLQVIERVDSALTIRDGTIVVAQREDAEATATARYFALLARRTPGLRLNVSARPGRMPAIRFVRQSGYTPEGYALDVGNKGVSVTASTKAGMLYGAVSLWQLLTAAPNQQLKPVHIDDQPRFPWRGLVLDSVRHYQSPDEIVRTIDWMALHKLNRLQWHLSDDQAWRLQIKRYPRLTNIGAWRVTPPAAGLKPGRYGGFYTQAQVRHIVAFATSRNVTIVPEIEMPGHATAAILAYPHVGLTSLTASNLGDWGVFPSIYGVNAQSLTFLRSVLDEVMTLFPSHEIAIGGDEAVHKLWHSSSSVQMQMRKLGLRDENALQGWFVGQIGRYLNEHGHRLVGWDEILTDPTLAKDDIVLSWHGANGAIAAARAGHDVVMATAPTLYLDNRQSKAASEPPGRGLIISLKDVYSYDPGDPPHSAGTSGLDQQAAKHVLGVEAALWTEHIATNANLEAMALPRAAALAEIGWTASARLSWPNFVSRMPAMMARYRALGLAADDGAFVPQASIAFGLSKSLLTLSRQIDLGDIRYTTDGTAPTATSKRYEAAIAVDSQSSVRAATFVGEQQISHSLDLPTDRLSLTRRSSQQLELCTERVPLNLASQTGGPFLVDIKNPCWIYRKADLRQVHRIAVSIAALPFNFQLADEPAAQQLPTTANLNGELVIRRGCDGPPLAIVPLSGAAASPKQHILTVVVAPEPNATDLCILLARPTLDPLWALEWVELRP